VELGDGQEEKFNAWTDFNCDLTGVAADLTWISTDLTGGFGWAGRPG
jgi:hypothetical protein